MELKPLLSMAVASIIVGAMIFAIGTASAVFVTIETMEFYGGIGDLFVIAGLGVFGLLGASLIWGGWQSLARRREQTIVFFDKGIEVPVAHNGAVIRVSLSGEEISSISKDESVKGRLIRIALKNGEGFLIQARHYCTLNAFLDICRKHNLPTE
ncbi:MAG: hypothetical protein K1X53_17615 [Candidatus Sumerlaeaceae bacterium]|nr:hypothetical protein [Candidatus Sumerlaeaceae bacterium]